MPDNTNTSANSGANTLKGTSRFAYPFPLIDSAGEVQDYFAKLAQADDGFFPLGKNGQFHGGVHFDERTNAGLDESKKGVTCIADGEIIAYRYNYEDLKAEYDNDKSRVAYYSNAFVLVRHKFEAPKSLIPPPPATPAAGAVAGTPAAGTPAANTPAAGTPAANTPAAGTPAANTPAAGAGAPAANTPAAPAPVMPSIFLYSLYMHLENYEAYEGADKETPKFWKTTRYEVEKKAKDAKPTGAGWEGAAAETKTIGLNVRDNSNPRNLVAWLSEGTKITVKAAGKGWQEIASVDSGKIYKKAGQTGSLLVFTDQLTPLSASPEKFDGEVFIPTKPIPIKAGELIGHLGNYMRKNPEVLGGISERKIVHIELFAGDDLPKFIEDCRALAKNCPPAQKTLLEIKKGAKLVLPDNTEDSAGATNLRVGNREIPEAAFTRVIHVKTIQRTLKEQGGKRWFFVGIVPVQANKESATMLPTAGWAREEGHSGVKLCSPWAFPGFEGLECGPLTVKDLGMLRLFGTPVPAAGPIAGAIAAGKKLFSKVDPQLEEIFNLVDKDQNKMLSLEELQGAFRTPWLAQFLSKRIVKGNNEWGNEIGEWDALIAEVKDFMKEAEGGNKERSERINADWKTERERLSQLLWWKDVKGKNGFLTNHKVYHLHPIAMAGCFGGKNCSSKICDDEYYEYETTKGVFKVSDEAFRFILRWEGYVATPYVPTQGGQVIGTSGITMGYGYDLGQQSAAQIRSDLAGIFTSTEIDRFAAEAGKRGTTAVTALPNVSNISVSKDQAYRLAIVMKRRYAQQVVNIYPEVLKLHPLCQGMLLSLVVNRGNGLVDPSSSTNQPRLEMRQIQEDFRNNRPEDIPGRLESMKRLWTQQGLKNRRDEEAKLFRKGLSCVCFQ